MAHPLELSYNWRPPVLFATVGVFVCVALVIRNQVNGWVSTAVVLTLLWIVFLAVTYLRTRAWLMADGSRLVVRRYRGYQTVEGADVVTVKQLRTASGPSYRLGVSGAGGELRRVVAPVALLRQGHATLFGWILAYAPQAELDRGSRQTLVELQNRGLVA